MRNLLDASREVLASAGVESPALDAELLLAHCLQLDRTTLFGHPDRAVDVEDECRFQSLVARRAAREPLPYIRGFCEWLGLRLVVRPGVLIPRPETEVLVEAIAGRSAGDARILDVGTGSGCIAIGLCSMAPQARMVAMDVSEQALAVARENAVLLGFADRIDFVHGALRSVASDLGTFDAVVSNPPYIPSQDVQHLQPEVRDWEPRPALDGGRDGLTVIRDLGEVGAGLLKTGGLLAIEVCYGQAAAVCRMLDNLRLWQQISVVSDLAGIARIVLATRR